MNGNRRTVLIVDDVPDDIAILDEILKRDYQVKAVTNGEAALKVARGDSPPDLILLDILMPGMDGFEVCRTLKQDSRGSAIPVIFLTAKVKSEDERLGLDLGAVDYIRKPIEPDIVLRRVEGQLARREELLRASELRFRRLFETSIDGIVILDGLTGVVLEANPALARIMGCRQEHFLGKRLSELDFPAEIVALAELDPNDRDGLDGAGRRVRLADRPLRTLDGRDIYLELYRNVYPVDGREVVQLGLRDIGDLVAAEREILRKNVALEGLLREKGELLREIHHRVNNNVQIMMSLLNLSSEQIQDAMLKSKLDDIARRMQSMAIAHLQFYQSDDVASIDFFTYLERLTENLLGEFPEWSGMIDLGRDLEGNARLSLSQAIPAGLIAGELMTNAMKFARLDGRPSGRIRISLRRPERELRVEVSDEGSGLPDGFDPDRAQSLGMLLVRILSAQLNGSVEFRRGRGVEALLRFEVVEG